MTEPRDLGEASRLAGGAFPSIPDFLHSRDRVRTAVPLATCSIDAVRRVGYRLARRFTLVLDEPREGSLPVTLVLPRPLDADEVASVVRAFCEELLDQQLRETVARETAPLRALILAQAFSRTDLIRRE